MKKFLQPLLFFWTLALFAFNSSAQVSIGSGTTTGQAMPVEPYFGFSYSQSVYLASEIGASGTITGVTFYATPSTTLANTSEWVIYMAATPRTSFASTTDWEPITSFTEVFNGTATIVGGEVVITFTTPFVYNGTDNLIIATEDNQTSFDGSGDDFYCSGVTGDRGITFRSDTQNPDPLTPPTASGLRQTIPNIEFAGIAQSCPTPSALTATNVTVTSADLGWTENGSATSWNIEYGTAGFTPTGTPTISGTANNPEPVTGLTGATDYEFYVQADCGGSGTSNWAGPFTFTTLCPIYTPVYSEDFTTYVPNCWEEARGSLTASSTLTTGTSSWFSSEFGNTGTNDAARMNIYTSGQNEWLISPSIDLTGGPFQLKYDVALTDYNATAATTLDPDDSLVVVISTDDGATWSNMNMLQVYTSGSEPSNTGQLEIIDLTAYTGVVKIGFYAVSTQNLVVDNDVFIDNFIVEPIPACPQVTGLMSANLGSTSVDLMWTENGSATTWNVEYGTAGFTPTGTPTTTGVANPATISGLTANTAYEFYVQADCGGGSTSAWTGPLSISTLCGVYIPDYSEDFTNYVPECWEEATGLLTASSVLTVGTSQWTVDGFANGGSTGAARINIWDTNQDEWLISPSIDLTGGPFQLEYDVALTTFSGTAATTMDPDDSLAVVISTDNGATWSSTNILQAYTDGSEPSNTGQREYIDLSSYSGVVKFGFYGKSTSNLVVDNNAYIDNFLVTALCLPATSTDTQVACDTYTWIDGNTYTSSNNTATFTIAGGSVAGCDSIITLDLTINNGTTSTDTQVSCDSLTWIDGITYTSSNNTATFIIAGGNANGCDSTITLDLTIGAPTSFTDVQTSCDSLVWNGTTYTSTGMYMWTGTNASGCDSIVTLDLTINNATSSSEILTGCDTLTWNGTTYSASGTYTWTGTNAVGCDSVVTLDLTINNATSSSEVLTGCDTLTWNGTTYSASGTYIWTGTNAVGCDSVVTLDLTINNSSSSVDTQVACDSLVWNGTTYTSSGTYSWVGTNAVGCDSSVILNLTINNATSFTDVQTACDSIMWNGTMYTTSGMYMWTGTNAAGCDSVVTLDLTINMSTASTVTETACESFDWNGSTYTTSGMYMWTGTNAAGCDSVVTLDLTINTVDVSVTNNDPSITADAVGVAYLWIDCDNNNIPIAGETAQTFTATANGNYAVIITNNGCADTSDCIAIVTVSLDDVSPFEFVSVYPNPVSNVVNVDLGGLENAQVRLLDMSGKVLRTELCETTDVFTMDMNQAPGAYIIEVQSNEFVKQFKLIKE